MESREDFKNAHRLVIKLGSSILCSDQGLNPGRLRALAEQISQIKSRGLEVILVSSGAVAAGYRKLGLSSRPTTLRLKQACAAAGQVHLMAVWEKTLSVHGLKVAQMLLTAEDLANRTRFLNAKNTLFAIMELGGIPIINENDTVAVEELKVGDNDTLGSLVASLAEADLFINLTDIDGLYDTDPRQNPKAHLIHKVDKVTPNLLNLSGADSGPLGTGGMFTKVRAASQLSERGLPSVVANGLVRDVLIRLLSGEELGTFFKPSARPRKARKHWLAFATRPKGRLLVDSGARQALVERGTSLLPKGIIALEGLFAAGDAVTISAGGQDLGIGLVNYNSPEVQSVLGHSSQEIEKILGYSHSDEVIHRDNLVIFQHP